MSRYLAMCLVACAPLAACASGCGSSSKAAAPPSGSNVCEAGGCDSGETFADAWVPFPDGGDLSLLSDASADAVAPFTIAVTPSTISVGQGSTAAISVTATRTAGFTGAVTVVLAGLPANVTSSTLVLPSGSSQGSITVSAAAMAAVGTTNVFAWATGNGSTSAPVTLDVTPPAGTLDTSFGTTGIVSAGTGGCQTSTRVFVLPSQALLYVGCTNNGTTNGVFLARYTPAGALDATFGAGGVVAPDFTGQNVNVYASALQADGKLLVAGQIGTTSYSFFVERYTASGTPDTTFGTNGVATATFPGQLYGLAQAIAVQGDGKVVAAGYASNSSSQFGLAIARFNTDGSLDTTFDSVGCNTPSYSAASDTASAVAVQADGAIVVAGTTVQSGSRYPDWLVTRYSGNGALDTGFATTGRAVLSQSPIGDGARAVAIRADGSILVAGDAADPTGGSMFVVERMSSSGAVDTTFGSQGRTIVRFADQSTDTMSAMAMQADGSILLAGSTLASGMAASTDDTIAVTRLRPSGALDGAFATGGKYTLQRTSGLGIVGGGIAVQADGRVVVAATEQTTTFGVQTAVVLRLWP